MVCGIVRGSGDSSSPVPINSGPDSATVVITDERGIQVHIGWFIVDPLNGDMYKLSPERIDASLAASMTHNNSAGDGSIHVVLQKDVPQELRGQLIPIN